MELSPGATLSSLRSLSPPGTKARRGSGGGGSGGGSGGGGGAKEKERKKEREREKPEAKLESEAREKDKQQPLLFLTVESTSCVFHTHHWLNIVYLDKSACVRACMFVCVIYEPCVCCICHAVLLVLEIINA
jgi:hypothetical protein